MILENYYNLKSKNHITKLEPASIMFLWANILDLATTAIALSTGRAYETNPIVASNSEYGWMMFLAFKIFLVMFLIFYYELSTEYIQNKWFRIIAFLVFSMFTIDIFTYVLGNIYVICQALLH